MEAIKEYICKRSNYRIWELNEMDNSSVFDIYLAVKYQ